MKIQINCQLNQDFLMSTWRFLAMTGLARGRRAQASRTFEAALT
jgi:hypothetical protein